MRRMHVRQPLLDWISIWSLLIGFTLMQFGSPFCLLFFGITTSLFVIRSNDRESAIMALLFMLAIIGFWVGIYSLVISRYFDIASL